MQFMDNHTMDSPGNRPPLLPTSVLQFGTSPPQSWLQSPPTQMPWGTSQPSLVRFTAEPNGCLNGGNYFPSGCMLSQTPSTYTQTLPTFTSSRRLLVEAPEPCLISQIIRLGEKRKLELDNDTEMVNAVNKLHISERKMASHHQGMHALSSGVRSISDIGEGQRLVLSEEVQQFNTSDDIVPQPLLDRMTRPSMALVLWQPPNPRVMPAPDQQHATSEDEDEENNVPPHADVDNNNSSTVDLNHLPSFGDVLEPPQAMLPSLEESEDIDMEQL